MVEFLAVANWAGKNVGSTTNGIYLKRHTSGAARLQLANQTLRNLARLERIVEAEAANVRVRA